MRNLPKVLTKLELAKILRQMLGGHGNMRGPDGTLQDAEERFDGVHMAAVAGIDALAVFNSAVGVAVLVQPVVRRQLVSVDRRAFDDMGFYLAFQRCALHVRHDLGDHFAVAVLHCKDNGLAARAAPALPRPLAADIAFICFYIAVQRAVAVQNGHVFADFMAHAPSRLVGASELALKLFRADAVARHGEQVHGVVPALKRHMRAMEGRADHRVNVVTAPFAGIRFLSLNAIKGRVLAAVRAVKFLAETCLHQVIEAHIIVRELSKKLVHGHRLRHGNALHVLNIGNQRPYVKGIDGNINVIQVPMKSPNLSKSGTSR